MQTIRKLTQLEPYISPRLISHGRMVRTLPSPPNQPHYNGLTLHERKVVNALADQLEFDGEVNFQEAGKVVNPELVNANTSIAMISKAMRVPVVREAYLAELDRRGINDAAAADVLDGGFKAKKTMVVDRKLGITKDVPDHSTRLRALSEFHKVKGMYAETKVSIEKKTQNLHILATMSVEELQKKLADKDEEIKRLQGSST